MTGSGVFSRISTVAAFVVAWVVTFSLAFWAMSQPAFAQAPRTSPAGDLAFNAEDLDFVLEQIKIAERHVAGESLADILPNDSVPWGLRTVDGQFNNTVPGQEGFGAADLPFPVEVDREFIAGQTMTAEDMDVPAGTATDYNVPMSVQDARPRMISHLIVNQSASNPAAVDAAIGEDGSNIGPDIAGEDQFFIPNTAVDEGLSAPFNAFMTFFGQFFDHGLDLINKGGNGVVYMPIPEDDPLFDPTPGANNFMVMPRATRMPGPDGIQGTADDVHSFINATTPHVDQQQTYGSHASAQVILRHYDFTPAGCEDAPGFTNPAPGVCYLENTGHLVDGFGPDRLLDTADDGGMATWDTAQLQGLEKFGVALDDGDGANIPMFAADFYGRFIPGPARGLPQIVIENLDGSHSLIEGDLENPVDASQAVRVNHSFFLDVAHSAAPCGGCLPDEDTVINPRTDQLAGQVTRGIRASAPEGFYDDELLGAHFICGDGRCNENIALTTVHTIFHREHNRLTDVVKRVVLDRDDCGFLNEWLDTPIDCPADLAAAQAALTDAEAALAALNPADLSAENQTAIALASQAVTDAQAAVGAINVPDLTLIDKSTGAPVAFPVSDASLTNQEAIHAAIDGLGLDWHGERIFQAARFGTEMQYNRIVFDEFSPTIAGLKDVFEGYHTNIDPSITAEYAQSVYRFGHSMLTETVDRFDADFNTLTDPHTGTNAQLGLFEAFLNPCAFQNSDSDCVPTMTPEEATGAIVRGITRTTGNEIDEFITGALQNNLVGLPLDLGAINIARGRDVGNPTLNAARKKFYAATGDLRLNPYIHWVDYADNMRHAASLVNFIAAYGTHSNVAGPDGIAGNNDAGEPNTYAARRAAACGIVSVLNATFCEDTGFVAAGEPVMVPADAMDFLYSRGAWANTMHADGSFTNNTGVDDIDFWNGGLAEERQPFGGYLGSTHNFVFENQLENLQNGDKFYYVGRVANHNFLSQLESNSFTALVMRNSDLGEAGAGAMNINVFGIPHHILEVDQSQQFSQDMADMADEAAQAVLDAEAALATAQAAMAAGGVADPAKVAEAAVAQVAANTASMQASAAQTIAEMEAVDLLVAQRELVRQQALGTPTIVLEGVANANNGRFRINIRNFQILGTLTSSPPSVAGTCNFTAGDGVLRCDGNINPGQTFMLMDSGGAPASAAAIATASAAVGTAQTASDAANATAQEAAATLVRANVALAAANEAATPVLPADVAAAEQALADAQAAAAVHHDATADPEREEPLFDLVIRDAALVTTNISIPDPSRVVQYTGGDHTVIGGTEGDDTIIGGIGDDSLWGRAGNDRIEGGDGADLIAGGPGDDILTDLAGPDVIEGGSGHDAIHSGNEEDVIFGDEGNDFIVNGSELGEMFGGEGDDYILDGVHLGHQRGGGGDDWMENLGGGEDLWQGDHGAAAEAGEPAHKGNDVLIAWAGNNDGDMENGDDIVVDGPGIERAEGQMGFDWMSFEKDRFGVNIDLDLTVFLRPVLPPSNNTIANRYDRVEGASGSSLGDIIRGTRNAPGTSRGNELQNFALITGLDELVPVDERIECLPDVVTGEAPPAGAMCWSGGDIILGGDGSDLLVGEEGDDIIDGDSMLKVGISTPDPAVRAGTEGVAAMLANSTLAAATAQADADEAAAVAADAAKTAADAAEIVADDAQAAAADAATQPTADAVAANNAANIDANIADAAASSAVANDTTASDDAAAAATAQSTADASAAAALAATQAAAAAQATADAAQAAATDAITALADATLIASLSADAVSATTASFMADLDAFSATTTAEADAGAAASAATTAAASRATAIANDPTATDAADTAATSASAAATAQAAADAATDAATEAFQAFLAADAAANAADVARNDARAAADASALLVGPAQTAADNAAAALAAAETTTVVERMGDIMGAVFAGMINPGELSISRVISNHDGDNGFTDTDAAYFTGAFEDYSVEGDPLAIADPTDPAAVFSDANGDGFLQVTDNRGLALGDDGRDLLRNIERLVFSDQTVVIDPRRLTVPATHNAVATGTATREARGPGDAGFGDRSPELGGIVRASAGAVRDATNAGGLVNSVIDWVWESELEPGSGMFEPILVETGFAGNGDLNQKRGPEMTITANEVGLQIRATGIFQDDEGVFEIIRTPVSRVLVPEGFVFADGLIPPVANAVAGSCNRLQALPIIAENISRAGRPRIDFTIVEADLADFTGTLPTFERTVPNVNDPNDLQIDPGAELAVGNIFARFVNDLTGEETAVVAPEIVAVLEDELVPSLGTKNGTVDISWSIRGDDVAPLVSGNATATFALDIGGGQECVLGTAMLSGMSGVGDAVNVVFNTVNGEVPDPNAGLPTAGFIGGPADSVALQGTAAFENVSRPGLPRLDVIIPNVDLGLFINTGFSVPVAAGDEILIDTFTLTFRDSDPASVTGTFAAEIAAISDPVTGVVSQDQVNIIFSIRGDDVAGLVDGVGTATVTAGLVEIATFDLFGNSTLNPEDVVQLVSELQRTAAATLDAAQQELAAVDNAANQAAVNAAALAFEEANTAAQVAVTEAELAAELAALPTATFLGGTGNLPVARTTFLNASRPGLARLDIRIADLNLALFDIPNEFFLGGCPTAICEGDEIAVDGISLTFSTALGANVTGIFAGEIVARVDPVDLVTVDQGAVDMLFSIRGDDIVGPLVPAGLPTSATLGVTDVATGVASAASVIVLSGDSLNDPEGVAAVAPGQFTGALLAVNVAKLMGSTVELSLAQADLTRALALAPAVIDGPVARALTLDAVTDAVNAAPATPADQPADNGTTTDTGSAHPQFPATGVVDDRGRIRIEGNCNPGGLAWAPPLNCRSHEDGTFDCRGRAMMPGTEINVTCSGGEAAIANLVIGAVGKADKRGQLRINGICETGEAWSPKLQCSTRPKGTFRCTSNGKSNPEEEAIVYCR